MVIKYFKLIQEFIKNFSLDKHYLKLSISAIIIIFLIVINNAFDHNNELDVESYNYYATMAEEKNFVKFIKAQDFLNQCKTNFLMLYPDVKKNYDTNNVFHETIDQLHTVDFYIRKEDFKIIEKFIFWGSQCETMYVVDLYSIIGIDIKENNPKFIKLTDGLEQQKQLLIRK